MEEALKRSRNSSSEGGDLHHIRRVHGFVPGSLVSLEVPATDADRNGDLQKPDDSAAAYSELGGAHAASREQHRRGADPILRDRW